MTTNRSTMASQSCPSSRRAAGLLLACIVGGSVWTGGAVTAMLPPETLNCAQDLEEPQCDRSHPESEYPDENKPSFNWRWKTPANNVIVRRWPGAGKTLVLTYELDASLVKGVILDVAVETKRFEKHYSWQITEDMRSSVANCNGRVVLALVAMMPGVQWGSTCNGLHLSATPHWTNDLTLKGVTTYNDADEPLVLVTIYAFRHPYGKKGRKPKWLSSCVMDQSENMPPGIGTRLTCSSTQVAKRLKVSARQAPSQDDLAAAVPSTAHGHAVPSTPPAHAVPAVAPSLSRQGRLQAEDVHRATTSETASHQSHTTGSGALTVTPAFTSHAGFPSPTLANGTHGHSATEQLGSVPLQSSTTTKELVIALPIALVATTLLCLLAVRIVQRQRRRGNSKVHAHRAAEESRSQELTPEHCRPWSTVSDCSHPQADDSQRGMPVVYIAYCRKEHERVLPLYDYLCSLGIECVLDKFHATEMDENGAGCWLERQLLRANFFLVVLSSTFPQPQGDHGNSPPGSGAQDNGMDDCRDNDFEGRESRLISDFWFRQGGGNVPTVVYVSILPGEKRPQHNRYILLDKPVYTVDPSLFKHDFGSKDSCPGVKALYYRLFNQNEIAGTLSFPGADHPAEHQVAGTTPVRTTPVRTTVSSV